MAKRGGFPGGGMPGNMQNLMKQAQRMQRQMEEKQAELEKKQEELGQREFKASAGGGAVTVTLTGKNEVLSVEIQKEAVDPEDVETLQDMIVAALNEGLRQVEEANNQITESAGNSFGGFPF